MAEAQGNCADGHQKTHDLIDDMKRQIELLSDQVDVLREKGWMNAQQNHHGPR